MSAVGNRGLTDGELGNQLSRRAVANLSDSDRTRITNAVVASAGSRMRLAWVPRRLGAVAAIGLAVVLVAAGVLSTSIGHPSDATNGVLSGQDLVPLVKEAHDSGATTTVLARVTVDRSPVYSMSMPICLSEPCDLPAGFVKVTGVPDLLLRAPDDSGFGAFFGPDDLFNGVVALDVTPAGLELLGVVKPAPDGSLEWPATASGIAPAYDVPGTTIIVPGFLIVDRVTACPPNPNNVLYAGQLCSTEQLGEGVITPAVLEGNIFLQPGARAFAPPSWDGVPRDMPRATYVLRLAAHPPVECVGCRGWEVVGRVGARVVEAPPPQPSLAPQYALTVDDLNAVIQQTERSGTSEDVIVGTNLDVKALRDQHRLGPGCFPGTWCPVGLVEGTQLTVNALAGSDEAKLIPDGSDSVGGPMALRVNGSELTLLGFVLTQTNGSNWWPAAESAVHPLESEPLGHVIAIDGWLNQDDGTASCPGNPAPTDSPFESCPRAMIAQQPFASGEGLWPAGGIRVQPEAYREFASDPAVAQGGGWQPRRGIYLLSLVEDPRPESNGARGWRVIGRITLASPVVSVPVTASPSPEAVDVHVLTLQELQAELAAAQTDGRQRTVIANVAIDASLAANHRPPTCDQAEACPTVAGEIVGVPNLPVWALPGVAQLFSHSPRIPIEPKSALLALSFGSAPEITLQGLVLPHDSGAVLWPADGSTLAAADAARLGNVIAVHGWLDWSGPLPCPMPASPTPPPNSPFQTCPSAWITAHLSEPGQGETRPPTDSVPVQPDAFDQFVECHDTPAADCARQPVEGTWLLRLVEDPRPNADPKRGWELVERLDEGGQPSPTPTPSPPPSPISIVLPDDPQLHDPSAVTVGAKLDVRGWLVDDGPAVPCPSVPSPKTPPPDIYEPSCYDSAWITRDEFQPTTASGSGFSTRYPDPANSVRVQGSAYDDFAPDSRRDNVGASSPRLGSYRLQLVRDPRFPVHGAVGWRMTARLDP